MSILKKIGAFMRTVITIRKWSIYSVTFGLFFGIFAFIYASSIGTSPDDLKGVVGFLSGEGLSTGTPETLEIIAPPQLSTSRNEKIDYLFLIDRSGSVDNDDCMPPNDDLYKMVNKLKEDGICKEINESCLTNQIMGASSSLIQRISKSGPNITFRIFPFDTTFEMKNEILADKPYRIISSLEEVVNKCEGKALVTNFTKVLEKFRENLLDEEWLNDSSDMILTIFSDFIDESQNLSRLRRSIRKLALPRLRINLIILPTKTENCENNIDSKACYQTIKDKGWLHRDEVLEIFKESLDMSQLSLFKAEDFKQQTLPDLEGKMGYMYAPDSKSETFELPTLTKKEGAYFIAESFLKYSDNKTEQTISLRYRPLERDPYFPPLVIKQFVETKNGENLEGSPNYVHPNEFKHLKLPKGHSFHFHHKSMNKPGKFVIHLYMNDHFRRHLLVSKELKKINGWELILLQFLAGIIMLMALMYAFSAVGYVVNKVFIKKKNKDR